MKVRFAPGEPTIRISLEEAQRLRDGETLHESLRTHGGPTMAAQVRIEASRDPPLTARGLTLTVSATAPALRGSS